jgi:hypothetical protein
MHHPWIAFLIAAEFMLLFVVRRTVLRKVGGPAWSAWEEQSRHLSLAQRWTIWLAVSRRKRVSDQRLVSATLARIRLARALLGMAKRKAFLTVRLIAGIFVLIAMPASLLGSHPASEPAWIRWYIAIMSLIFGFGLIFGYPWLIRWSERRMDQAERANQIS